MTGSRNVPRQRGDRNDQESGSHPTTIPVAYMTMKPAKSPANAGALGEELRDTAAAGDLFRNLHQHLRDRAGANREEQHREHRRISQAAGERAGNRRRAADDAEEQEIDESRALPGQRRHDREAFGRVVQREADDEQRAESRFAERERGADREPFAEVVEADPDGHHEREDPARPTAGGARLAARAEPCAECFEPEIGAPRHRT